MSDVARLAGVTIRTLHHYDEIGLVRPSARNSAGYRLYGQGDLERLQQVLFFRELDFPLDEIKRIVADSDFDVGAALQMQRRLLTERAIRIKALIAGVDAAIDSNRKGTTMSNEERFEVFGDFDPSKYEHEVKERWGTSDAYRESAQWLPAAADYSRALALKADLPVSEVRDRCLVRSLPVQTSMIIALGETGPLLVVPLFERVPWPQSR